MMIRNLKFQIKIFSFLLCEKFKKKATAHFTVIKTQNKENRQENNLHLVARLTSFAFIAAGQ